MQKIRIEKFEGVVFHNLKHDENIDAIAKNYGVLKHQVLRQNKPLCKTLMLNFFEEECYVVQPLDTLFSIAKKLNVSVEEIEKNNDCKALFIGQKLKIKKTKTEF